MNVADDESHTHSAPAVRSRPAWAVERTMQTRGISSSLQTRLSICPRFEAAAVCTTAVWPSARMVSIMPSTVIGLTNDDAPSAAFTPSGSGRHAAAPVTRYWAYMAPPATATTLPRSARAAGESPQATTVPAPSLPAGRDRPIRAAAARAAAAGSGTVTTGRSVVPPTAARVRSAPANSSPRSDGLMGAASTRTTTSSGPGAGTSASTSDSSTVCALVSIVRSCSPVPGTSLDTLDPFVSG